MLRRLHQRHIRCVNKHKSVNYNALVVIVLYKHLSMAVANQEFIEGGGTTHACKIFDHAHK